MGFTHTRLKIAKNRDSAEMEDLLFLVDSGAQYSLVPQDILERLGVKPDRKITLVLADRTRISRNVGEAHFAFRSRKATSPVIFGEKGDEPLLGVVTLENLGLVLNPLSRRIYPQSVMPG
jgi:clan AA aspartic protease